MVSIRGRNLRFGFRFLGQRRHVARRVPRWAIAFLAIFVLVAIFAPIISPYSANAVDLSHVLVPPAWARHGNTHHLLGTDQLGRDVLSRIIYGVRPSLIVSTLATVFAGFVGTAVGLVAAFYRGVVEEALMRLVDIVLSFPAMVLGLLFVIRLGPSLRNVVIVISILLWTPYARQIRGDALVVIKQGYVALARTAGVRGPIIIVRHILPNVFGTVLTMATFQVGVAIVLEASLSFLGVGIPPPQPTWGGMISEGSALGLSGWWLSIFPGLALVALVFSANRLGDWVSERMNPRSFISQVGSGLDALATPPTPGVVPARESELSRM